MPRGSKAPHERMQAIEILLLWEGQVSRSRLLDFFEIHPTLASRDIAAFCDARSGAANYDTAKKAYVAALTYRPQNTKGIFREYLQLLGIYHGREGAAVGVPFESALEDSTEISYPLFSRLHNAVREQSAVEINYRSLHRPTPHRRIIRPHAFAQAGPRWHVRAYCADALAFRDFNLGRIIEVGDAVDAAKLPDVDADEAWNTMVTIRLVPHTGLSPEQQRLVRAEYFDEALGKIFEVRAAMARYLVHTYRAAMDPDRERAPEHLLMVQSPELLPAIARWKRDAPP